MDTIYITSKSLGVRSFDLDTDKNEHVYLKEETGVLVVDKPNEEKVWFNKNDWGSVRIIIGGEKE